MRRKIIIFLERKYGASCDSLRIQKLTVHTLLKNVGWGLACVIRNWRQVVRALLKNISWKVYLVILRTRDSPRIHR